MPPSPMPDQRRFLYIIGVPGSGKSTLVAALVQGRRRRVYKQPVLHTLYEDGLVQLGRERATSSGTDAMSMSVQPYVKSVLETGVWGRVLAEGDRLANPSFFRAVGTAGYKLDVALLDVPEAVAAARRAMRGSNQDERWLAGRRSKVANLEAYVTIRLDGTRTVEELVAQLADHPVTHAA